MPVQCIYTLPVDDPYKKGYVYCTGVVITKKDRVGMALKMYFTDSGKKRNPAISVRCAKRYGTATTNGNTMRT